MANDDIITWLVPDMCLGADGMYPVHTRHLVIPPVFQSRLIGWLHEGHAADAPECRGSHPLRIINNSVARRLYGQGLQVWERKHIIPWNLHTKLLTVEAGTIGHWVTIVADPVKQDFVVFDSSSNRRLDSRVTEPLERISEMYDAATGKSHKRWSKRAAAAVQQSDGLACGWATVYHTCRLLELDVVAAAEDLFKGFDEKCTVSGFADGVMSDLLVRHHLYKVACRSQSLAE
jgi:hypothetical protein